MGKAVLDLDLCVGGGDASGLPSEEIVSSSRLMMYSMVLIDCGIMFNLFIPLSTVSIVSILSPSLTCLLTPLPCLPN